MGLVPGQGTRGTTKKKFFLIKTPMVMATRGKNMVESRIPGSVKVDVL